MMPEILISKALEIADAFGGIDGAHHKQWVIDQMVRALTGCPIEIKTVKKVNGAEYSYEVFGESEVYQQWVARHCAGEDGPHTYEWDTGIAP